MKINQKNIVYWYDYFDNFRSEINQKAWGKTQKNAIELVEYTLLG